MLKKVMLAAIALSFAGASFAQAQSPFEPRKPGQYRAEPQRPSHGKEFHGQDRRRDESRRDDRRRGENRAHFNRGQRYGDWRRHQEIRDYKHYGLRAPGRGQRWIKVDDQYLLITAATGFIAGVLVAR